MDSLEKQLKDRPDIDPAIWGERDSQRVAEVVTRIAAKEMGWSQTRFVPQDPMRIVFWAHEDGLDYEAAVQEIEAQLEVDIGFDSAYMWMERDWTLGQMIEAITSLVVHKGNPAAGRRSD